MINTILKLKQLRGSLNEEYESDIIKLMKIHHRELKDCITSLNDPDASYETKQNMTNLFLHVFNMHSKAEGDVFYRALRDSSNHAIRQEALKGHDEHEIAFEIADELKEMDCAHTWSEEIDAKVRVLMGFMTSHLREEENIMFPMAEKYISKSKLMSLADEYLEKCRMYLDMEMEMEMDNLPSDVSRNDVMTFFY